MSRPEHVVLGHLLVSIHQVMRRCGKKNCRCARGLLHGPYWQVRFRTQKGKRRIVHLGKQLPPMLAKWRTISHNE